MVESPWGGKKQKTTASVELLPRSREAESEINDGCGSSDGDEDMDDDDDDVGVSLRAAASWRFERCLGERDSHRALLGLPLWPASISVSVNPVVPRRRDGAKPSAGVASR